MIERRKAILPEDLRSQQIWRDRLCINSTMLTTAIINSILVLVYVGRDWVTPSMCQNEKHGKTHKRDLNVEPLGVFDTKIWNPIGSIWEWYIFTYINGWYLCKYTIPMDPMGFEILSFFGRFLFRTLHHCARHPLPEPWPHWQRAETQKRRTFSIDGFIWTDVSLICDLIQNTHSVQR